MQVDGQARSVTVIRISTASENPTGRIGAVYDDSRLTGASGQRPTEDVFVKATDSADGADAKDPFPFRYRDGSI